jgi:SHS2 domain-containing protein
VHRWTDHTSELGLEIEAGSESELFAEAALALAEILAVDPRGEPRRRDVQLASADRATLLADWLEELVYLAETDGLLPERASVELEDTALRASVEGRTATPRHLVKAVTYHGLELTRRDGAWRATVVLDV